MTFDEYFENKHKELIQTTREEYDRINDPNFIEMGATYRRINKVGDLITPIHYEWGIDENDHQISWKNVFETERDKDSTFGYSNVDAPLLLIKMSPGNGQYPPNRFRTRFHYIDGVKTRFWCFTSRDYKTNKLSFEMRFHIGKAYHCVRGSSWYSKEGCFSYIIELDNRTQSFKRDLTMREVKYLIFGNSRYKVDKHSIEEILQSLNQESSN